MDSDILAIDEVLSRLLMVYRHLRSRNDASWQFLAELGRDLLQAVGSTPNDLDDRTLAFVLERAQQAILWALQVPSYDPLNLLDDEIAKIERTREMIWESE